MQKNIHRNIDQKSIISRQNTENCLDTIQLNQLEQSYRSWLKDTPRFDVRLSRKRILLIFLLIRYTGAKLSEILSIDPFEDIDLDKGRISIRDVHSKNKAILRTIPIPQSLVDDIKSMMSEPDFSTLIKTKFSIDPGFVRRKFYERSKFCGFNEKLGGPEMIRKARAVELLQNNMPLPVVQSILGHSTLNLTQSMVAFSEKEIQRVTQLFMDRESDRKTSARNSFFGKIKLIEQNDVLSRIEIVSIDGFSVITTITTNSLVKLGFKKADLVTVEIKSPSVMLQMPNKETEYLSSCSAENQFKGIVTRASLGPVVSEYVVRISDVTEICSTVTTKRIQQLELKIGDEAWVLFNSFSVVLHKE